VRRIRAIIASRREAIRGADADLTRASRATAWRELSDLVAKGCLVPTGQGGRSSAYEIPWEELV